MTQSDLTVWRKAHRGELYDYEVYLRQDWKNKSQFRMERETSIGTPASRHADQADFKSNKYMM